MPSAPDDAGEVIAAGTPDQLGERAAGEDTEALRDLDAARRPRRTRGRGTRRRCAPTKAPCSGTW